jgi:hypothetical protein
MCEIPRSTAEGWSAGSVDSRCCGMSPAAVEHEAGTYEPSADRNEGGPKSGPTESMAMPPPTSISPPTVMSKLGTQSLGVAMRRLCPTRWHVTRRSARGGVSAAAVRAASLA